MALPFERPPSLQATLPAEVRSAGRDDVRLLASVGDGHTHHAFTDLPYLLEPGDLLVANRSATLPASLPAEGEQGRFLLNLSTRYAPRLWLAEPRWSHASPRPVPLAPGDALTIAGVQARLVAHHPRLPRLAFIAFTSPIEERMAAHGAPIRYGYVQRPQPLEAYQTVFADVPGSAEMPSAARPFTERTLAVLADRGVDIARITLHTGVSSLEAHPDQADAIDVPPEPFAVSREAAGAVARARRRGSRVLALGTTVVRALESAWNGERVVPTRGFTRRVVRPGAFHGSVDGILTGMHDADSSHLAMLFAIGGRQRVIDAYRTAVASGYLWHEFGDVHLLWRRDVAGSGTPGGIRRGSARAP